MKPQKRQTRTGQMRMEQKLTKQQQQQQRKKQEQHERR
jgi:hypothetical protein